MDKTFFTNLSFDVLLHIVLLSSFLFLFFTFHVAKVSRDSIQKEVKEIIKSTVDKTDTSFESSFLENNSLTSLIGPMKDINTRLFNTPSEAVKKNNNTVSVVSILFIVFSAFLFVLLSCILRFYCGQSIDMTRIIIKNVITFFFVAIIEVVFFKLVISKYVPVTPSYMVTSTINEIKKV